MNPFDNDIEKGIDYEKKEIEDLEKVQTYYEWNLIYILLSFIACCAFIFYFFDHKIGQKNQHEIISIILVLFFGCIMLFKMFKHFMKVDKMKKVILNP